MKLFLCAFLLVLAPAFGQEIVAGTQRLTAGQVAGRPGTLVVGRRFAVTFEARFHRIGLDDNGTGEKNHFRLRVGAKTPGGSFGAAFRLTGDRYEVDGNAKIFRTDSEWRRWRFEIDTAHKTVAMFRDDAYVCLHRAGSKPPPGVQASVAGDADVEIRGLKIAPLPDEDALSTLRPLPTKSNEIPGEWRMWRRDERNTGASDLKGAIRTPRIAWRYPVGQMAPAPTFLDLDGDGGKEALISHGGNLTAYRLDGRKLWEMPAVAASVYGVHDLAGDARPGLVIASGNPTRLQILDPATGALRYECPQFPQAGVGGVRIAKLDPARKGLQAVVWSAQHEVGFVLRFDQGIENAQVAWTFDWKTTNFSPTVCLADMDRDGALDLVVTTYDRTFVFDGRRGRKTIDYKWSSGRNYGITVVRDIDRDGFPDVVVLADFLREHVAVLKNLGGKSLKMLWDNFYEQDYPDDNKSLRLLTESVDDFDGDGEMEIAGSVYDGAWKTFLLDARTGAVKQNLPGLCLVGAGAVFPGQPPVLIVSRPTSRDDLQEDRLALVSCQGGAAREVARLPDGDLLNRTLQRDFPPPIWSTHLVHTAALRPLRDGAAQQGLFLSVKNPRAVAFLAGEPDGRLTTRWQAAPPHDWREPIVATRERPRRTSLLKQHERAGRALDAVDLGTGTAPALIAADESGALRIVASDGSPVGTIRPRVGFVTLPVVGRLRKNEPPRLLFFDAKGEVQCLRIGADGRPERLWSRPGSGSRPYLVPYLDTHGVPVLAAIDGSGEKVALISAAPNRLVALDADGNEKRVWSLPDRPVQWLTGNFDGDARPDLFVTYPTGAFLDMESAVLSGVDGKPLWKSHVGNGAPGVADLNGDGRDDILLRDLFERRTLDGRAGRDILPTTQWAGYHTPVILPLAGLDRPPGVAWVGGMYSVLAESPIGAQRWWRPANSSLRDFGSGPQAVADVDGDGRYEIGGITAGQLYNWPAFYRVDGPDKEFLCYDALTGAVKWRYFVGASSAGVIAADVDGDGKPEFVFGTNDGRLLALRGEKDAAQRVLWELSFPAALGQPVVADIDGSGRMTLLVSCADGNLYGVVGKGVGGIGKTPSTGLWLLARKDAGNTARADVPGKMATAPRVVWSYGGGGDAFSFCQRVTVGGKTRYFGQVRGGLRLIAPDGKALWSDARLGVGAVLGVADFCGDGALQALVTRGQSFSLIDVATGKIRWSWSPAPGIYLGTHKLLYRNGDSRLVCFPQNTLQGVCFRLPGKNGVPELLWDQTFANAYWPGYGPQIVLAEMDNAGAPEVIVAGKPGYAGVIDIDTGTLKFEVRYPVTDGPDIGRPYGLLIAEDLDGDGFRDIVMASCQVEEYIGVLRNVGGKALTHAWSQFVEKDYPEDQKELRPQTASLADIDGDGKKEIVVGLFNAGGDGKWHTVAFEAFEGWKARKLDLPGRFFWGCYDLDGDSVAEVIVSDEAVRRTAAATTLRAIDGRTGRDRAVVADARLSTLTGPLPQSAGFLAFRATPIFVAGDDGGLLLRRRGGAGPEERWRLRAGQSVFTPLKLAAGARAELLSRPLPALAGIDPDFRGIGGPGGADASAARVAIANGRRELILTLSDGRVVGGAPDWKRPGHLRNAWSVPGALPSLWLGPDGARVVCTVDETRDRIFISRPLPGKPVDPLAIRLPYPIYQNENTNSAATVIPFGEEAMHLFVGLQTGVHTLACALYDAQGKELWLNPKVGPYPRTAAVARLSPGAPHALIVNDHYNKTIFSLDGRPALDLPYGSRRNGIMVNTPYALPLVGPFGPGGATRIVFTPGLDTVQTLAPDGKILANRFFNTYEFEYCGSAVATLRPDVWDLGMVNHDGIFHCVDLATGQSRWSLDLGGKATFAHNVSSVDLDGDGRDNFLIGLPSGELVALDERDGKGVVLWRKAFPAGVRDAFGADIDGDGWAELLVETDDGRVCLLR